jgi:glycerate dehydrogenase
MADHSGWLTVAQSRIDMNIVFLDSASLIAELRPPQFPHRWVNHARTRPDEVLERLADADIAVVNKAVLNEPVLVRLPRLKLIAVAATGVNNVDLDACRSRGIAVANIRDYAVHTVPEHVFMMVLALRRNLLAYRRDLLDGQWRHSDQFCLFGAPIHDLHGATLGIVGYGSIGRSVARLGEAFGMRVLLAERRGAASIRPGYSGFEEVLRQADVLTLHVPLSDDTRLLIGEREIGLMKPDAVLINCARGGVVDETALTNALDSDRLAGAGFDVLTQEPPEQGHPLLALADRPNFILTPHVAWASRQAMQELADQLIENIEAFVAGKMKNRLV